MCGLSLQIPVASKPVIHRKKFVHARCYFKMFGILLFQLFLIYCSSYRRWKKLFPNEVPLLQEARKIQKAALISNFVDRESERPALGPTDFRPRLDTDLLCNTDDPKPAPKRNVKTRLV